MLNSLNYDYEIRNNYIRYLIKLLSKKYFVRQAPIAESIGLRPTYLRDFSNGNKNMSVDRLNLVEYFINDLYGGIIEYEVPQTRGEFDSFIKDLSNTLTFKQIVG